jgi:hypothetical protein
MHITLLSSPFIVELELGDLDLAGWRAEMPMGDAALESGRLVGLLGG